MTSNKRVMYSERHAECYKKRDDETTNDKECHYTCTCLYNIRAMKLLS